MNVFLLFMTPDFFGVFVSLESYFISKIPFFQWLFRNFAVKSDHGFAKKMVLSGFMKTWFDRQQGSDTDLFFIEKSLSLWHNDVKKITAKAIDLPIE